jgi:hypothetical protein
VARYEIVFAPTELHKLTVVKKVIADLWERYMKLLDEGVSDG